MISSAHRAFSSVASRQGDIYGRLQELNASPRPLREYNARADWLCSEALDTQSSFSFVEENLDAYRTEDAQWEAFSDGGCRGDGWSAFAWIVYVVIIAGTTRHRFIMAMGYEIVQGNYPSFLTELWGLERASEELERIAATSRTRKR